MRRAMPSTPKCSIAYRNCERNWRYEQSRGNATYAEVEESEADLERFRGWLAKITNRDYFRADGGQVVRDAVAQAATELAAFEDAALRAEAPDPPLTTRATPIRAVDGS